MAIIERLIQDENGATAIEYGLIAALVSVAIITILGTLSDNLIATFEAVSDGLVTAAEEAEPEA
jgi:pilus assembly protein Flp/PilA